MKHPANAWKNHFAALATALLAALAPALAQPAQQAYVKASNTGAIDWFGYSVAVSGDTMVVGTPLEQSCAQGINGDQTNNGCSYGGAAYVYVWSGTNWIQQAYLKASNAEHNDVFGESVSISGDTIVVGAHGESSNATGVNGDQTNNSIYDNGAAYVFVREGTNWTQQAYLKPSYIRGQGILFGVSVGISGNTILVGAMYESGGSSGVNGVQTNLTALSSGAAYVFIREGTNWTQQAYLKASNTGSQNLFGWSVAISGDTIIVGAPHETSSATGLNGNQTQDTGRWIGAAYIFVRNGTNWSQQAYVKASSPASVFGISVALSGDTAVVWANTAWADPQYEGSTYAIGINPPVNNYSHGSVAYVFVRNGTNWTQQAFIKPAYMTSYFQWNAQVSLSGNTLVIGNSHEFGGSTGINGNENDQSQGESGAVWVYVRRGTNWNRKAYLKSSNSNGSDHFGMGVGVSGDTVVATASLEDSAATGINGNQNDNTATDSGAAYVFTGFNHGPELSMTPDGTGGFFLRFNAIENLSYRLERSPNVNGPWTTNATFSAVVTAPIEFHDTNAPPGQAFYRVAQQ